MSLHSKLQTKGTATSCTNITLLKDGHILLGRRHYEDNLVVWILPGGRCDEGETLEEGLRREVQEEVGISDISIEDFIAEIPGANPGDTLHMFFGTTSKEARLMEPDKFSEWRWVSIANYIEGKGLGRLNPDAHKKVSDYLMDRDL